MKILYQQDDVVLCVWNSPLDNNEHWAKMIDEKASYDQKKTSIRLERAYCRVYQPEFEYWNSKDFDPLVSALEEKLNLMTKTLGLKKEPRHFIESGMWGLVYSEQETCGPHGHGKSNHYAGTYYFVADPGCGTIFFPEIGMEVQPEPGDILLFNSRLNHGVMPNRIPAAKRICVAFNLPKSAETLQKEKEETENVEISDIDSGEKPV